MPDPKDSGFKSHRIRILPTVHLRCLRFGNEHICVLVFIYIRVRVHGPVYTCVCVHVSTLPAVVLGRHSTLYIGGLYTISAYHLL